MIHPIGIEQARNLSTHEFVWRARLRSGDVICEQPGVSSDHLPADEVVGIDYVPCRDGLPTIETHVALASGERFVRYWTNIWAPNGRGVQRLYVVGIRYRDRHALIIHYPGFNKVAFSAKRPFQPSWRPDPFRSLPSDAVIIGGPGTKECGWCCEGFGGVATVLPGNRLSFRSVHR